MTVRGLAKLLFKLRECLERGSEKKRENKLWIVHKSQRSILVKLQETSFIFNLLIYAFIYYESVS